MAVNKEVKAVVWTCDACGARSVMTELEGVPDGYHGIAYQAGSWGGSGGAAWWACRRSHITRAVIAAIERENENC